MSYWLRPRLAVTREALTDFAWSVPMRDLAVRIGLSDVGLKKLLKGFDIATPPQGHWNRVAAGRAVPKPPLPAARRPGQHPCIYVDARFAGHVAEAPPLPIDGPFPSPLVPADLEELRTRVAKAVGRVAVPQSLERYPDGLAQIIARQAKLRAKFAASPYAWTDNEELAGALNKRRLRILSGLLAALQKQGCTGSVDIREGELCAHVQVGNTAVHVRLNLPQGRRPVTPAERLKLHAEAPANTKLELTIGSGWREATKLWTDGTDGKIDGRLAEIAAAIIVEGEAGFRRGVREAHDHAVMLRERERKAREERQAAVDAERLKQLRLSGERLREAEEIRLLVARVRAAMIAGDDGLPVDDVQAWEAWALAYADRVDPVKSGQVREHLRPRVAP